MKSGCACEWDGWGRLSDDGLASKNQTGARAPGVEQQDCSNGGAQAHNCPDTERGYTGLKAGGAKEGCKPDGRDNWAPLAGKAPFDKPTLKPYWGKLTVRNFRGTVETSASFEARYAPSLYPTNQVGPGPLLELVSTISAIGWRLNAQSKAAF